MPSQLIYPKFQAINPSIVGAAAAGFKLKTFSAGTTTPLATYTDSTLTVANPTTIIMDANGEANVWLGGLAYKFVFTDPADVVQWTVDNVTQSGGGSSGLLLYNGSAVSLPNSVITSINTAGISVAGDYLAEAASNGIITFKQAGRYLLTGMVVLTSQAGTTTMSVSTQQLMARKNGSFIDTNATLVMSWPFPNGTYSMYVSFMFSAAFIVGDTLDFAWQAFSTGTAPQSSIRHIYVQRLTP